MKDLTTIIRVAAVQMESIDYDINTNLQKASEFVYKAAKQKAKLILFPEFMSIGYNLSEKIWNYGETENGPTNDWLRKISKNKNVWVGTSYLEVLGENYFNTFALANPDGNIIGKVRKQTPATLEAFYFIGENNSHVIITEIGKIGVGICYENQLSYFPRLILQQSVDILVMPHSAPRPVKSIIWQEIDIEKYINNFKHLAYDYSKCLGIPVILANKCGKYESQAFISEFLGYSTIVDNNGIVKGKLNSEEGIIVADITIGQNKNLKILKTYGRWAWKVPWRMNVLRIIEAYGSISYNINNTRKKKAQDIYFTK